MNKKGKIKLVILIRKINKTFKKDLLVNYQKKNRFSSNSLQQKALFCKAYDTYTNKIKNPNLVTNSFETLYIMQQKIIYPLFPIIVVLLTISCSSDKKSDAYGNFEAISFTVSAEGTGRLISFKAKKVGCLRPRNSLGL